MNCFPYRAAPTPLSLELLKIALSLEFQASVSCSDLTADDGEGYRFVRVSGITDRGGPAEVAAHRAYFGVKLAI